MEDRNLPTINYPDAEQLHAEPAKPGSGQSMVRPVAHALLSAAARDLDAAPLQPGSGATDMDRVYMKHQALTERNEQLRILVEKLTFQQDEDRRGHAAETLRLSDQIEFLKSSLASVESQRNTFAAYGVEVKARMESLTKVMLSSAQATEAAIESTMAEIESFVEVRLAGLRELLTNNARTATALTKDALDAAAAQGVVLPLKGSQAA